VTNNEPAVTGNTVLAVVQSALVLLTAFGVALAPDQSAAILGLVSALIPASAIVTGFLVRQKVTPVSKG